MKVVKPLRLSALHRPSLGKGKTIWAFPFWPWPIWGLPRLRPEPELWQLAAEELTLSGGVLDLAIPKACAEFLATGNAYTHHQQDKTACAVKIQLDSLEKRWWFSAIAIDQRSSLHSSLCRNASGLAPGLRRHPVRR